RERRGSRSAFRTTRRMSSTCAAIIRSSHRWDATRSSGSAWLRGTARGGRAAAESRLADGVPTGALAPVLAAAAIVLSRLEPDHVAPVLALPAIAALAAFRPPVWLRRLAEIVGHLCPLRLSPARAYAQIRMVRTTGWPPESGHRRMTDAAHPANGMVTETRQAGPQRVVTMPWPTGAIARSPARPKRKGG